MHSFVHPTRRHAMRGSTQADLLAGGAVIGLLALGAAWFLLGRSTHTTHRVATAIPALTVPTPSSSASFADGSTLTLSTAADSELVCGATVTPAGAFSIRRRSLGGGNMHATVESRKADGILIGHTWSCPPGNLLLACRLLDPSGRPLDPALIHWNGSLQGGGSSQKFSGWQAMTAASADATKLPEVFVQLADGAGGWIDGSGPFCDADDAECRGILAFPAWPRSGPELEFRAVRPGQLPVSWKIKNPLYPVTPAAWTPDALPKTHSDPEFELVFRGASVPNDYPSTVKADYRFTPKIPGEEELSPNQKSLACECAEVQGAFGTRSKEDVLPLEGDYVISAFRLPPDETLLRFRCVVSPTDNYRYARKDAVLWLKGKVAADGKTIELDPAMNPGHGFVSARFESPTSGSDGIFKLKLEFAWKHESDRRAAESALLLSKGQPVCFVGNDAVSCGAARITDSGQSSNGHESKHDMTIRWLGIPKAEKTETPQGKASSYFNAAPQPGDEITIGMVHPKPAREIFFTMPRPAR